MASRYLNTDLFLGGPSAFDALVAIFERRSVVLFYEQLSDHEWRAAIEAVDSGDPDGSLTADIESLLDVIDTCSPTAHDQWQQLTERQFDIGWQAAAIRPEGSFALSNALLQRI